MECGGLISFWPSTETKTGWVYATGLSRARGSGWAPLAFLKKFPETCEWMMSTREVHEAEVEVQLPVGKGEVLLVDIATATEVGWIRVETCDGSGVGWVPAASLNKLPSSFQWLPVTEESDTPFKGQLFLRHGSQALVDPAARTAEGWVYAWATDIGEEGSARHGWVPANALQWTEAGLMWHTSMTI